VSCYNFRNNWCSWKASSHERNKSPCQDSFQWWVCGLNEVNDLNHSAMNFLFCNSSNRLRTVRWSVSPAKNSTECKITYNFLSYFSIMQIVKNVQITFYDLTWPMYTDLKTKAIKDFHHEKNLAVSILTSDCKYANSLIKSTLSFRLCNLIKKRLSQVCKDCKWLLHNKNIQYIHYLICFPHLEFLQSSKWISESSN
jgi:hypothetical protein